MNNTMQAIITDQYGSPDVLQLKTVPKPTPNDDEVLVKIHVAGTNALDWRLLRADPFFIRFMFGLRKPKFSIIGADVAGTVEAVGKNVTQFKVGDAVFGDVTPSGMGGFAEYVCTKEDLLALKPDRASWEDVAAIPVAGLTALQGLRDVANVQAGQKVMIHGASGGVGTFSVQVAKALGAEVTGVCSTAKVEITRSLGADHVIDYTKDDFATNGQKYDLIFAANGNRTLDDYLNALAPTGTLVVAGGTMRQLFESMLLGKLKARKGNKSVKSFTAHTKQSDLQRMAELVADGSVKPYIDRVFPLAQTAEAIRYMETGRASGKVLIAVNI